MKDGPFPKDNNHNVEILSQLNQLVKDAGLTPYDIEAGYDVILKDGRTDQHRLTISPEGGLDKEAKIKFKSMMEALKAENPYGSMFILLTKNAKDIGSAIAAASKQLATTKSWAERG